MKHLTWLGLRGTTIGDQAIKQLRYAVPSLFKLSSTQVSDNSIRDLSVMKNLEEIYLWDSKVTDNGVESLRKALPDAKVVF